MPPRRRRRRKKQQQNQDAVPAEPNGAPVQKQAQPAPQPDAADVPVAADKPKPKPRPKPKPKAKAKAKAKRARGPRVVLPSVISSSSAAHPIARFSYQGQSHLLLVPKTTAQLHSLVAQAFGLGYLPEGSFALSLAIAPSMSAGQRRKRRQQRRRARRARKRRELVEEEADEADEAEADGENDEVDEEEEEVDEEALRVDDELGIGRGLGLEAQDGVDEVLLPFDVEYVQSLHYTLKVFPPADMQYWAAPAFVQPHSHPLSSPTVAADVADNAPPLLSEVLGTANRDSSAESSSAPAASAAAASTPKAAANGKAAIPSVEDLPDNHVVALFDYTAQTGTELSFNAGDVLNVLGQYSEAWWKGEVVQKAKPDGEELVPRTGYFPSNYVAGLERIKVLDGDDPNQDEDYFESYNTLTIHHQMLSDDLRTRSYRDAVRSLKPFIEGKVVMDIGCGTSILSMFCAQAGARHVFAVDASNIIHMAAAKVVKENGMTDRITLIRGKIEEIDVPFHKVGPDVDKLDVIISEWMGTFMVCESMIESVLWARAKYLRDDGLGMMMPTRSTLVLAPICIESQYKKYVEYWDDVYGVKMTSLKDEARRTFFGKPTYDRVIEADELLDEAAVIWDLDLATAMPEDLEEQEADFEFVISRDANMHGFGSWFDSLFAAPSHPSVAAKAAQCPDVVLPTSPHAEPTHWKQVQFILDAPLPVKQGDQIQGKVRIMRNKQWRRHYECELHFTLTGSSRFSYRNKFELWR